MNIKQFLWDYLNQIRPVKVSYNEFDNFHYLDNHLDSFEIIQFILAVESEFSINLTPKITESEEFRTIGGLIDIISRLQISENK